ncbi:hypothetical protein ACA910_004272 [Epithemia clementina (nom. ined.)]
MLGPGVVAGGGSGGGSQLLVPPSAPSSASSQQPPPSSLHRAPIRKSRLRRAPKKPVPTHILPFAKNSWVISLSAVGCFVCCTVIPIWILEGMTDPEHHPRAVHGVHQLMSHMAQRFRNQVLVTTTPAAENNQNHNNINNINNINHIEIHKLEKNKKEPIKIVTHKTDVSSKSRSQPRQEHEDGEEIREAQDEVEDKADKRVKSKNKTNKKKKKKNKNESPPVSIVEQQAKPHYTLADLPGDEMDDWTSKPVARGLAGRPLSETPAMVGARRAHISDCEINVDSLAYWNDPVGTRDLKFQSPFAATTNADEEQYMTFSPDRGGWNNVRMSMEILFVLAAATGRTLVLPPKEPLYLLNRDAEAKHRGFADFFPLDNPNFPVKLMSMEEFLTKNPQQQEHLHQAKWKAESSRILNAAQACDKRKASDSFCGVLHDYLDDVGHNPGFSADHTCLIFDEEASQGHSPSGEAEELAKTYCGDRNVVYWNEEDHGRYSHLHFPAGEKANRLLTHFYNMIYFADPAIANYMKRFVRDYLHYNDAIYCAAGKIVKAVQAEGMDRGFSLDEEKGGAYSAMHIRRGDLQYKKVKIPAREWYDNTKEVWLDKEILYIATDERNKTFFDDLARYYDLRFLDDYWELAGLSELDPNYMGMIDTIVASRGRAFAGTWFSTFSGYINRLRGYHGMSMMGSWYSFLPKKTGVHEWPIVTHYAYAFEWPDGWVGIDADVLPQRDKF